MNKEIKQRWINALRSGEYPKTEDCLRDNKGYCCLGVLTDIAIKDGVIEDWQPRSYSGEERPYAVPDCNVGESVPFDQDAVLPTKVMEWAELTEANPFVRIPGESYSVHISDPNDNGYSFQQIADLIEEQL